MDPHRPAPFNPPPALRGGYHWIYYGALVLTTLLVTEAMLMRSYQARIDEATHQTYVMATSGTEVVNSLIDNVGALFPGIGELLDRLPVDSNYDDHLRAALRARKVENPYLLNLLVVNPDASIAHWAGEGERPSITDREYITAHTEGHVKERYYVGPPQLSRVHPGQRFFAVSTARRHPDGSLRHILVAIIDIAYIHHALQMLHRPPGGTLLLTSADGLIYSREPNHNATVGRRLDFIATIDATDRVSSSRMRSPIDGHDRVYSLGQTHSRQLLFIASLALEQELKHWWLGTWLLLLVIAAGLALIGWLTHHLYQSHRQLLRLSSYDALSGVFNRAAFLSIAKLQLAQEQRYPSALSLIMLDIDNFKLINDRFGHNVGDRVIKGVGGLLSASLRQSDISCRWGGEEFLLLLPHTPLDGCAELAEKLRQQLPQLGVLPADAPNPLTASFGVAELRYEESLEALINRADEALYQAKGSGKNRVCRAA